MKKIYEGLLGRYSLPDYERVNHLFEISDLEESEFIMRHIRQKIGDKLANMIKVLDSLLNPEGSYASLHEIQFIDEPLRGTIFELYKELNLLERTSLELSLKEDDAQTAEFIRNVVDRWDGLSSKMLAITLTMKEAWNEDFMSEAKLGYLG